MKKLRVLIVDDEPLAREGIAALLKGDPDIETVEMCDNGHSALAEIRREHPDLVFLDVQIPFLNGIELLARLDPDERPAVILITAFGQHALEAFEACVIDYLVKPFRDVRFKTALDRAKMQIMRVASVAIERRAYALLADLCAAKEDLGKNAGIAAPFPSRLVLKIGAEHHVIETAEIAWIEAQGNNVKMAVGAQTHVVRLPLQALEQRLDPACFVRTHRSFIVNSRWVRRITPAMYGDCDVHMRDGTKLRLSRTFRGRLQAILEAAAR